MPRILAPNQSFQRRSTSRASLTSSSRTSLNSEPPLRRSSLSSTRGYQNPTYESAFSLRRSCNNGPGKRRQTFDAFDAKCHSNGVTQQTTKQNAVWELQGPSPSPTSFSKDSPSVQTESTATSSQFSSIATLPSTNGTSSTGLAAALTLMMQQKGGSAPNGRHGRQGHPLAQSVPCSPNPPSTLAWPFDPNCKIVEEPDCWGQFVDVQSKDEDLNRRSRVMRRYPGAPLSFPRY